MDLNIFNIRSWADLRAFLQAVLPAAATAAAAYAVIDKTQADLWVALFTALLGPGIAAWKARTVDLERAAFYAIAFAAQGLLLGYHLVTNAQLGPLIPLIVFIVGAPAGGVAAANTDTTPAAGPQAPSCAAPGE